eukprot:1161613-Pelagomonas_calceolata.AAC.7
MKTEHHNVAGRMITKAHTKSPLGAGLVNTDKGSDDRSKLTSSRPVAILVTPYHVITSSSLLLPAHTMRYAAGTAPHTDKRPGQQVGGRLGAVFVRSIPGRYAHLDPTKIPPLGRDIHLVGFKSCPDTKPYATLEAAAAQHTST